MPLTIALVFGLFCAALGVVVLLYSRSSGAYLGDVFSSPLAAGGGILAGILVLACLAGLFQWIYGMDFVKNASAPTSYVFVIDDSGSMTKNDANNERYRSILTVMRDMQADFPYMVYSFTDTAQILRDMAPLAAGETLEGSAYGNTNIKQALQTVLLDRENGVWKGGDNPKVLLLSDGESPGFYGSVLSQYAKRGIAVSTVGFGAANDALMENIASRTGGVYIPVSDIAALSEAIRTAVNNRSGRDLISARPAVKLNALYAVLRVLFLTILGTGIGVVSMLAYGRMDSEEIILASSAVTSLLGALALELGTWFGLSDSVARLLYWVLTAALVCMHKVIYNPVSKGPGISPKRGSQGGTLPRL